MSSQLNSPYEFEHIDSLVKGPLQGCINNFSYNWCFSEHFSSFFKNIFFLGLMPAFGWVPSWWLTHLGNAWWISEWCNRVVFQRLRLGIQAEWVWLIAAQTLNHQEEEGIWASVWHLTLSPKWLLKSGLGPGQSKDWEVKWQGHSGTQWCTGGPAFFFSPRM